MASLRQKKKQHPAKRAWKNFTNMVKSKFRDMEIASSVRNSTARVLRFISRRLIVPFRTRYLQNNSYTTDKYHYSGNESSRQFLNAFSRDRTKPKRRHYGYDDDYYSQIYQYQSQSQSKRQSQNQSQSQNQNQSQSQSRGEGTSGSKERVVGKKEEKKEEDEEGMPEIADSMEDAWRRVVAASPHLQVDERADEFIYKFRESMKMEKERSFLEFQERLKRSA
ncbi:hypothetical protein CARUB_v10005689mg [Capsella rubella]|uniref:Cotton fiber protein n=1 Tax=Capsella rubella TaxID=81985 RepID=R0GYK8_9BRAS|nr:uncharacterized protein LOC17878981 [Capsella rubella]EOA17395.1 hypothetical protein CARUB_v10005689mg [Capsella rubella]